MHSHQDEPTPAEQAHGVYLNHALRCPNCYAPTKRYCGVGQDLRVEYDAQYLMTINDTYQRKAMMRRDFEENPVVGELIKNRVIELYNEAGR